MKKRTWILLGLFLVLCIGCSKGDSQEKGEEHPVYRREIYGVFDTIISLSTDGMSEEEAEKTFDRVEDRFRALHTLFDRYTPDDGVKNLAVVNRDAGDHPVAVSEELYNLVKFSKDATKEISPKVDIAMGTVIDVWNSHREGHEGGIEGQTPAGEKATLPTDEELQEAAKHANLDDVILNDKDHTISFKDPQLRLDVGAVAKGYATEIIAKELEADGVKHFLISAGGNVRLIGRPADPKKKEYVIGIQNPDVLTDAEGGGNVLDILYVDGTSVVSSGDYQRFYIVDGKLYHHIIDPDTLYPGTHFRAVTLVTKDSGRADFLSTAVFLLPYEEGRRLVENLDGVEAYWVFPDGRKEWTKGMEPILGSLGATNAS